MRTPLDRLRHAISFEIIALLMLTPLGALIFDLPMQGVGIVTALCGVIAMAWNVAFNTVFDKALHRLRGTTAKTLPMRVLHAILFEISLTVLLVPVIAWSLAVSVWTALMMDLGITLFFMVYAFGFNWGYDRLFPLPEWTGSPPERQAQQGRPALSQTTGPVP